MKRTKKHTKKHTARKLLQEATASNKEIKTNETQQEKGLSSSERLSLMIFWGIIISMLIVAINFAVIHLGIPYERWTTTSGALAVVTIYVILYFHMKKRMVDKESINAIHYPNLFALIINVLLSSIYLAHNESTSAEVSKILSQMNISFYSIQGKFFVDLADIVYHIPVMNMGHVYCIIGVIIFCMLRRSFQK